MFRLLFTTIEYIFRVSCVIGQIIIYIIFYLLDLLKNVLTALHIIGEEFYRFFCTLEDDAVRFMRSMGHFINDTIEWLIEVALTVDEQGTAFASCIKSFMKSLYNMPSTVFNTIRNSLILVANCIWDSTTFIPKLIVNTILDIGDYTVCIITTWRIGFVALINNAMFLASFVFVILVMLIAIWLHKARVYSYTKQLLATCCTKIIDIVLSFGKSMITRPTSKATTSLLNSRQRMERRRETRTEQHCVVCYDRLKCIVVLPCKHLCLCRECSHQLMIENINICPICRGVMKNAIKLAFYKKGKKTIKDIGWHYCKIIPMRIMYKTNKAFSDNFSNVD